MTLHRSLNLRQHLGVLLSHIPALPRIHSQLLQLRRVLTLRDRNREVLPESPLVAETVACTSHLPAFIVASVTNATVTSPTSENPSSATYCFAASTSSVINGFSRSPNVLRSFSFR